MHVTAQAPHAKLLDSQKQRSAVARRFTPKALMPADLLTCSLLRLGSICQQAGSCQLS